MFRRNQRFDAFSGSSSPEDEQYQGDMPTCRLYYFLKHTEHHLTCQHDARQMRCSNDSSTISGRYKAV